MARAGDTDCATARFTVCEGGVWYGARYRVEGSTVTVISGTSCVYAYPTQTAVPPRQIAVEILRTMIRSGVTILRTVPQPMY